MRYSELFEKRRGGDLNPRQSASDIIKTLQNYSSRGGEYYYISYTAIDKLGINPRSGYNTPIGIYCYPLNNKIVSDINSLGLAKGVPYMGGSPYIWLFGPKNVGNGLIISDYHSKQLTDDREKLFNFANNRDSRITRDMFDSLVSVSVTSSSHHMPSGYIWNLSRMLADILSGTKRVSHYTKMLLNVGDKVLYKGDVGKIIDVYKDPDEYTIEFVDKYGEPYEADIDVDNVEFYDAAADEAAKQKKLLSMNFKIGDLASLSNPKAKKRYKIVDVNFNKEEVILQKADDSSEAVFGFPLNRFYKGNPEYAPDTNESIIVEYQSERKNIASPSSVMWTYLLYRVLGYDYADDSDGEGLIHPNEKTQAVFFNRSVINVVDRFVNPTYSKSTKTVNLSVFSDNGSPEELEHADPIDVKQALLSLLKKDTIPSKTIPSKFAGHIVINSNKVKAKLILKDLRMYNYFKTIDNNLKKMLDDYIIKRIRGLNQNTIIDKKYSDIIWNYFYLIKQQNWPAGEQALLETIGNTTDADEAELLVKTFENNVTFITWNRGRELLTKIKSQYL